MDGRENRDEDIKSAAESLFGLEVIILHKLNYNLWEQAALTRVQKRFLIYAYNYVKGIGEEDMNSSEISSDKGQKKSQKEELLTELKRRFESDD